MIFLNVSTLIRCQATETYRILYFGDRICLKHKLVLPCYEYMIFYLGNQDVV